MSETNNPTGQVVPPIQDLNQQETRPQEPSQPTELNPDIQALIDAQRKDRETTNRRDLEAKAKRESEIETGNEIYQYLFEHAPEKPAHAIAAARYKHDDPAPTPLEFWDKCAPPDDYIEDGYV